MSALSRRRALHLAGGALLSALAGCDGTDSSSRSVPRENRDRVDDVTVLKVRNTEPTPMVIHERDRETEQTSTEEPPRRRGHLMDHVTDYAPENDDSVFVRSDVAGADHIRRFLEETDFETESVYLSQSTVQECYERHLVGAYREDDGVDAEFCVRLRPADAACETDSYAMTAFLIRLPFAGDNFNSVGGGGGSCDRPGQQLVEPDTSLTVGPNGGESQ